jgi:DNA polymerase elongation subunit (family B)
MKPLDYKIAFIDLENSPSLGFVWEKYETNVLSFERDWYIMSFAVSWSGSEKIKCYALPDFPGYRKNPHDDAALCKKLWEVFDEADLVVAHNGDRFDCRKANARFVIHGFTPPSPYRTVDTLKVARRHFMFTSNKLDDLCDVFGIGRKVRTGGFSLWLDCMKGVPAAWARMKRYNIHDVRLLRRVYERLRAWSPTHPNVTIASGESFLCPACSGATKRAGWNNLKTYRTQRYYCLSRSCGKFSSGPREKLKSVVLT